jgi:hypothetical protein
VGIAETGGQSCPVGIDELRRNGGIMRQALQLFLDPDTGLLAQDWITYGAFRQAPDGDGLHQRDAALPGVGVGQ